MFEKLCALASYGMFEYQDQVETLYDESELDAMKEQVENIREDQYLEDIYGASARVSYEDWMKAQCDKAKWIFDPTELRKRLCTAASV